MYMYIYPTAAEHTSFSSAHERVSMINPKTGQKQVIANVEKLKLYQIPSLTTMV